MGTVVLQLLRRCCGFDRVENATQIDVMHYVSCTRRKQKLAAGRGRKIEGVRHCDEGAERVAEDDWAFDPQLRKQSAQQSGLRMRSPPFAPRARAVTVSRPVRDDHAIARARQLEETAESH